MIYITHKRNDFQWHLAVIFVLLSIAYHPGLWTPHWCECTQGRGAGPGVQSKWNPHAAPQLAERWSDCRGIRQPSHRVSHSYSMFPANALNAHRPIWSCNDPFYVARCAHSKLLNWFWKQHKKGSSPFPHGLENKIWLIIVKDNVRDRVMCGQMESFLVPCLICGEQ